MVGNTKAKAWRQANLPRFAGKLSYAKPTPRAIKTVPATRVKVMPRSARARVIAKKPLRFAKVPAKKKVVANKRFERVIAARGGSRL